MISLDALEMLVKKAVRQNMFLSFLLALAMECRVTSQEHQCFNNNVTYE